ncbi:hypothetical protein SDC9_76615 [bioreactor metagenome]|uniref:Uncharacterized protein n=1 Tax=bioreactor metagenome TaxID=1076179 RepID=A0A644YUC0_9ZZZZ
MTRRNSVNYTAILEKHGIFAPSCEGSLKDLHDQFDQWGKQLLSRSFQERLRAIENEEKLPRGSLSEWHGDCGAQLADVIYAIA